MLSIKTLVSLFCPVELCVILIFNKYLYVTRAASRHYNYYVSMLYSKRDTL